MSTLIDSTDGVQVALHDFGGTGPVLLIVHATGFHGWCYEPIARRLTDRFHVIAPDLRGHGDSVYPEGTSMDWWNMAEDVCAVIAHVGGDEPLHAVGHSMGGASILMTELVRPGTFSKAWMFEPIVLPDMPDRPPSSMSDNARRRKDHFETRDEAFERYSSRLPFSEVDPEALRAYVDHGFADDPTGGVMLKCPGEIEAQVFESTVAGLSIRLGEIQTEITVVQSGDGGMPATVAAGVADALPNGKLSTWPDRSHFGPFEDPERAAADIRISFR